VDRYFTKIREGEWQLILDLRESVKFTQANLVDERSLRPQGLFDVIFCRNVLIYFDDTARLSATDNLAKMLNPGGYVCLGYAETMVKVTDRLEATRIDGALVYRRPV
jgi:chemotaxis protein methyltransferase CheR